MPFLAYRSPFRDLSSISQKSAKFNHPSLSQQKKISQSQLLQSELWFRAFLQLLRRNTVLSKSLLMSHVSFARYSKSVCECIPAPGSLLMSATTSFKQPLTDKYAHQSGLPESRQALTTTSFRGPQTENYRM